MLGKMSSTTRILEECELEERRANLSMIEEKARALLSRNERHALLRSCHAYASHQIHVDSFVDTLHQLLCTPSKATFWVELREMIRDEDQDQYDERVFDVGQSSSISVQQHRYQRNNTFRFESSSCSDDNQCLLQVDHQHHHAANFLTQSNRSLKTATAAAAAAAAAAALAAKKHQSRHHQQQVDHDRRHFQTALKESSITLMPQLSTAFPTIAKILNVQGAADGGARYSIQRSAQSCHHSPLSEAPRCCQEERQSRPKKAAIIQKCRNTFREEHEELIEVMVSKSKSMLGLAIEGGANTSHRLPRIISFDGQGTAFQAAGLRIGQKIIEVDGAKLEGKTHVEAAQLIAKSYANPLHCEMKLIVTANSFRPNANLYRPNS